MSSLTLERHNQKTISYDVISPGLNYRIDEIRSALGIEQLKKLPEGNRKRRNLVDKYIQNLSNIEDLIIPWACLESNKLSSYHIFPVLLPEKADRKEMIVYLREKGIQTSIHYPSVEGFSYYEDQENNKIPVANAISNRVITLPLYPEMGLDSVEYVSEQVRLALNG